MDLPKIVITVITVCFNEKTRLKKTIESVCSQTYPYIEYLIIDGLSMDGTVPRRIGGPGLASDNSHVGRSLPFPSQILI